MHAAVLMARMIDSAAEIRVDVKLQCRVDLQEPWALDTHTPSCKKQRMEKAPASSSAWSSPHGRPFSEGSWYFSELSGGFPADFGGGVRRVATKDHSEWTFLNLSDPEAGPQNTSGLRDLEFGILRKGSVHWVEGLTVELSCCCFFPVSPSLGRSIPTSS